VYRDSTDVQDAHRSGGLKQVFCTIATHAPDAAPHRPSHQGRGYSDKRLATRRPLEPIGQKGKLPDLRTGYFNVLMCAKKPLDFFPNLMSLGAKSHSVPFDASVRRHRRAFRIRAGGINLRPRSKLALRPSTA
jgi:hypothetical protein